jgi:hypothetical protein
MVLPVAGWNASTSPTPLGLNSVPLTISGVARKSRETRWFGSLCMSELSTAGRRQAILSCATLSLLI